MLTRLCTGKRYSISQLTEGTRLTRQAVTKHLRVLQRARLVHAHRKGRESLFELDPQPLYDATVYLENVSKQWDAALARLKLFIEGD
jgi:DNA-binding transcriptional ArsR family regulator